MSLKNEMNFETTMCFRVGFSAARMDRMDSEDFFVTIDSQDITLEELSGEHGQSREVVEAGENVIPVTDGEDEEEMEEGPTSYLRVWIWSKLDRPTPFFSWKCPNLS